MRVARAAEQGPGSGRVKQQCAARAAAELTPRRLGREVGQVRPGVGRAGSEQFSQAGMGLAQHRPATSE